MQALRFHEFGGFEKLSVETIPDPQPKADEVVVKVRAGSLNPSDAKNVLGRMEGTTLPRTPGRDFAGLVIAGPSNMIGQEVWGTGGDTGFTRDGSHAELIVLPAAGVCPKPQNLSFEEAASAGVNFVTAWVGLMDRVGFREGETVLVTGAGGGVGSAVIQLVKWKGGRTVGVDRSPMSREQQEQLGIDHAVIADADAGYKGMIESALGFSHGKGVDVVYDCVGGPMFEPCLRTLGRLGRQANITSVGERRVSFDLVDFYHRQLRLFGVDSRAYDTVASAALLAHLTPGFESGALKPIRVAKRFNLSEAREAYSQVNDGSLRGKAVFTFSA